MGYGFFCGKEKAIAQKSERFDFEVEVDGQKYDCTRIVYLSIGILSCLLFFHPVHEAVAALLALQIVYKVTTPFTVGTLKNPVVLSNLAIAIFHSITLASLWHHHARKF